MRVPVFPLFVTLSFLFGCRRDPRWEQQKETVFDFGLGRIVLPREFRFDAERTERTPASLRFTFLRVHDTHFNGQTSYAEGLILSFLAPDAVEAQPAVFDPLPGREHVQVLQEGGLEWHVAHRPYDRDPVHEPALGLRLMDRQRRIVLGWYGFERHYSLSVAKANLLRALDSVKLRESLDSRFANYRQWQGNSWMDAYFSNQKLLIGALGEFGMTLPFQPYVGAVSNWESKGDWSVAIDGERPAVLHWVRSLPAHLAASPVATCFRFVDGEWKQYPGPRGESISPDLVPGFVARLPDRSRPYCLQVHRRNFWEKASGPGNPWLEWLRQAERKQP